MEQLQFDQTATGSFAGDVNGSGGLTKVGTGNVTLTGTNTYTGITLISAGILTANSTVAVPSVSAVQIADLATFDVNETVTVLSIADSGSPGGGIDIASGKTLSAGTTTDSSFSGSIIGTDASFTKLGSGSLTLSGTNTYDGVTTIAAGKLHLDGPQAISDSSAVILSSTSSDLDVDQSVTIGSLQSSVASSVTLDGTATVLTTGGDNLTTIFAGNISGTTGALTKEGSGTFTLSGTNAYTGATTINDGVLAIGSSTALSDSTPVTISTSGTLNVNASVTVGSLAGAGGASLASSTTFSVGDLNDSTVYTGVMSGQGNFVSLGTGTLELNGANSYTGTTTIQGGSTLIVSDDGELSASTAVTIAASSQLTADSTFSVGSLAGSGSGVLVINATRTLTTGGDDSSTALLGSLIGAGNLTKVGTGTQTLSGTGSTFTGTLTVTDGTVLLGSTTALGVGSTVVVNSAGILDVNESVTIGSLAGAGTTDIASTKVLTAGGDNTSTSVSGAIIGTGGSLTKDGSGTLTLSGVNTFSGTTTINLGTLIGTSSSLPSNITNATILTFDQNSNGTFSQDISGIGLMNMSGSAILELDGTNSYSGVTNVNTGTLLIAAATALPSGSAVTVAVGATLDIDATAVAGSLAGAGDVVLEGNTLTAGGDDSSTGFSGVMSGTGGFTKDGSGNQTFSGANTFTGATLVASGTVTLGSTTALSDTTPVTVASGAQLTVNFDNTVGSIAGAGTYSFGSKRCA